MQLRKTFLWSMIASVGLAALLGIATLLLPSYGVEEEIIISAALFAGFSIVALMCAVVLERQRAVVPMWIGLGFATSALFVWHALVWFDRNLSWEMERIFVQAAGTFTVAGVLAAQSGLLLLPRFDDSFASYLRRVTIGPNTGRTRVRMVDMEGEYYHVARKYMIRLQRADLEDDQKKAQIAAAAGMKPKEFERRYASVVEEP